MQVSATRSASLAGNAAAMPQAVPAKLSRPGNYYASPLALKVRASAVPNPVPKVGSVKERCLAALKHSETDLLGKWLTEGKTLLTLVLLFIVIISGVSSVYAVQLNRQLFIELNALQYEQGQAQRRWTQLLLEESALNAPNRVELIASGQLGMVIPESGQLEMVK